MARRDKCYRRVKWHINELAGNFEWSAHWGANSWFWSDTMSIGKNGTAQSLKCARRLVRDAIIKIRKQIPEPYNPRRVAGSQEIKDIRHRIEWKKECESMGM